MRRYAGVQSDGVTGYASSAGFEGVFTGGKPCKTEKKFNPGEDLRSTGGKLIRSSMVITPARRDVDVTLGVIQMRSLNTMIKRWKTEGLVLLPPEPEAAVRETFAKVGAIATSDVISMYAILGGMPEMDKEYWRLWSLEDMRIENPVGAATGVVFSDYMINCWSYRLVPNGSDTSSVFVDYFNDDQCIHVAKSLEEFFSKYAEDPYQVLEGPHPGAKRPGNDA